MGEAPVASNPLSWLSGYKTYILAGCIIGAAVANHFGWLSADVFKTVMGLLLGGTAVTLRMGMADEVKKAMLRK